MTTKFKSADGTEWVLVPKVATEKMKAIGGNTPIMHSWGVGGEFTDGISAADLYEAMLTAAPQPPEDELIQWFAEIMATDTMPSGGWEQASDDAKAIYRSNARAIVARLMGD